MKKLSLILFLLHGSFAFAQHGSIPEYTIQIYSKETYVDTINERFYVHYKIYFIDTVNTDSLKVMTKLPRISDISSSAPYFSSSIIIVTNQNYYPGDSLTDSLEINFSKSFIPFHFQTLRVI